MVLQRHTFGSRFEVIPHAVETDVTSRAGHHVNYCSLVAPPTRRPVDGATGLQERDSASVSAA